MYFKTPFRGGNLENNFFKIKSKKTRFRSRKKLSSRERKKHALVHAYDQEKKYNWSKNDSAQEKRKILLFFLTVVVFSFFSFINSHSVYWDVKRPLKIILSVRSFVCKKVHVSCSLELVAQKIIQKEWKK